MKELDGWREKIDKLDANLVKLLNKRAGYAQKIGKAKQATGSPVYLPSRENAIVKRVKKLGNGPLSPEALENIFREIFSATRSVELALSVASLGPAGSFSHLAALKYFGSSCSHIHVPGIDQVFAEVEKGNADYGIVPIENSIEGTVGQTQDLLIDSDLKIYAEAYFDIHINLLSKADRLGDIKTLYTFSVPLAQCRRWVAQNLPSVEITDTLSSSDAARRASEEPLSAAIGAAEAGDIYGLNSLAENIEEIKGNQTRFFIISRDEAPRSRNDKTSIMFTLDDQSGALYKIIRPFALAGINLSKIQSRPMRNSQWEYIFFVDFAGHIKDKKVKEAVKQLEKKAHSVKILGSYPDARA
ncbi:Chorismate mutase I / Prephenate dehydratase [hydrothermal vent metagenome]|uniref:Bifunctional chorismate mutase/prephenate dehydratase n=1 Tax=hydrothermal vent metagenome TaxID=652676 RepID=A0A3B1BD81_9ZZZZ